MRTLKELAELVVIRNHLSALVSGTRLAIKRGDVPKLSALINKIDIEVIQDSLVLFVDEAVQKSVDDTDIQKKLAEAKLALAAKKASQSLPQEVVAAVLPGQTVETIAINSAKPGKKPSFKRAAVAKDAE